MSSASDKRKENISSSSSQQANQPSTSPQKKIIDLDETSKPNQLATPTFATEKKPKMPYYEGPVGGYMPWDEEEFYDIAYGRQGPPEGGKGYTLPYERERQKNNDNEGDKK